MKNINKNIIWLGWVSFFTDMASSIITILLPIFVVYVLQEGVDKLGIIIAVSTFVSYAFRVLFGYLSDRLGVVKPFLLLGYGISTVSKPLLAFSSSYLSVAMLRGFERMGKAVRSAPKDTLISAYTQERYTGRTFGFHKMMDISGELLGAVLLWSLFMFLSEDETVIRTIFGWTILPGAIAFFIILFWVKDLPLKVKNKASFTKKDQSIVPYLAIYFIFLFFIFSDGYVILKAKDAGYTLREIPLFVMLLTLTQALFSYYSGVLIDKKGTGMMLFISFVFGILSMTALYFDCIGSAFVMLGLFTVISLNVMRTFISLKAVSKGSIYGIFYGGIAIFASLGALFMGFLWEHWGVNSALAVSISGLSLTSIFLAAFLLKADRQG